MRPAVGATTRYELVRQLGAGGMAQVVEARSVASGGFSRRVAIKWLLPEIAADAAVRRMFTDEARVTSYLHHANIVQVLDYGEMEGTEFIVYEFVDGLDLRRVQRLTDGDVPTDVALHVVAEVAHALDYAHQETDAGGAPLGIVHRDVSPSNILASWQGDVKLADFGIALMGVREERTATGILKGKLSYIAPEQLRGERATPASDVFALGLTLHVLLTGHAWPKTADGDVEPLDPGIEPDIAQLLRESCAADPARRPDAGAMAERARGLRAARSTQSGRASLRELMESLAPRVPGPRSIDAYAGRQLVPQQGDSRVFELSDPSLSLPTAPTVDLIHAVPRAEARRGPWIPLALGALGLAAGVAATLFLIGEGSDDEAQSARPAPPPAVISDAGAALIAGPDAGPSRRDAGPSAPPDAGRRAARRRRSSLPGANSAEGEAAARGTVLVGGARLARGVVFLDGRRLGQAPGRFQVSVGEHALVVRSLESDELLLERTISVAAHNTASRPVRVLSR